MNQTNNDTSFDTLKRHSYAPAHLAADNATKSKRIPTSPKSQSLFKKSHTCGSLFAKCACNNENGEHRVPLLQTFSHPTENNCYFIQKKASNPIFIPPPSKSSLSNPELSPTPTINSITQNPTPNNSPNQYTSNPELAIFNSEVIHQKLSSQAKSEHIFQSNPVNIPSNPTNNRTNPDLIVRNQSNTSFCNNFHGLTNPNLDNPVKTLSNFITHSSPDLLNNPSSPNNSLSESELANNPNHNYIAQSPSLNPNLLNNPSSSNNSLSESELANNPNHNSLNSQKYPAQRQSSNPSLNPNLLNNSLSASELANNPNHNSLNSYKYIAQRQSSNPSINPLNNSQTKRLSNPELPKPQIIQKRSSKSTQNLYLHHPEITYPTLPTPRRNVDKSLAKSVPKHFESSDYISDYSENFLSNKNFEYHKFNAFAYTQKNCEDPAQKYFKESGIFGPMGGAASIRKNSNISNTDCETIRKISKSVVPDSKRKNSGLTDDYEYLKTVVAQLKKELTDHEIKVGSLERDLVLAKKGIRLKDTEVLKLQREVHKLKSVLQQTPTIYDTDILSSLNEQHGMANSTSVLQQSPNNICANKKQGVSAESSEFTGQASDIQIARYEKDFRSKQLIKDAIMDNNFLKKLDSSQVREIVDSVYSKEYPKESFVIREGAAGAHLFVSAEGEYEVIKDGNVLGKMGPGKAFGELAILYNCTRTASIQAVTDCRVWVLDRKVFQQIMMRTGLQRRQDNIYFLKSVPLLHNLKCDVLAKIADVLEVEFYPAGAYIIRQGASGDTFFIISSGNVKVTQRISGRLGEEEIRTLDRGDYFGEQALLKEDFRTASIIALHPGVECLTLDRDSFIQLIGDLSELQEKDYGDEQRVLTRPNSSVSVCLDAQAEYDYIRLDDLEVIATLGIGGFGRVELVQYAFDHSLTFALKCLKKQHIVDTQQQEHVFSEKNIMLSCRSPFICRMFRTYRDSKYAYMLLEACLGGEVWTILRDRGYFDDHTTRFITSCVIEAFSYLHTRGIIYRDLKPENLLLDSQGYVKLVDFGFSKRLGYSSKTWTFCGTPEYVSPETILNKGHDRAVDYWGLGILMHELLTGSPPFTASDPMKTYNLILKGIDMVDYPRHITRAAQSLIKRLCKDSPSERLGYQRGGIQDIKKHKWFQGFDWDGLKARTLPAPIVQAVQSPHDTSNFDSYTKDNDSPPDEFSGWDLDF